MSENIYNPYCSSCESCGEDGCCSWFNCFYETLKIKTCQHGQSYIKDAEYDLKRLNKFYELLEQLSINNPELKEQINKIEEDVYKQVYENDKIDN